MPRAAPRITLTDFIDIVVKSGTPKATAIKTIKYRGDYAPEKDFYKLLREEIVDLHRRAADKKELRGLLSKVKDDKKRANYPPAIAGYSRWWARQQFEWFDPPSAALARAGVELSVSPELGLRIGGLPHILKLHLKGESLPQNRADIINHVLEVALSDIAPRDALMGVVDARRGKLLRPSGRTPRDILDSLVEAELGYIATIWRSV